ncbi:hypothetical protein [Streptomyces phaeochromogenes]
MNTELARDWYLTVPKLRDGDENISTTPGGIRLKITGRTRDAYGNTSLNGCPSDLETALNLRNAVHGQKSVAMGRSLTPFERDSGIDHLAAQVLVLPSGNQWREAVSTALLGPWCDSLWEGKQLPFTALGALKAEARTLHQQLVPLWRRRTRHGRLLSLDAPLGSGLSLYDLVVADVDFLAHTAGGVFEDERLNRVLRGLNPAERAVVFAYVEGEGATWTEAAAHTGHPDPAAFGERVRRKAKRLAGEQHRRAAQLVVRAAHPGFPSLTTRDSSR